MAALERDLLGHPARLDVLGERHVHRLHPVATTRLHRRVDLVGLALADQVADGGGAHEHLDRGDASEPVRGGDELLRHHALEGGRELDPHLLLLVGREHVDDAVDRLGRILRVQRGEDEVTRLGRGDRGSDRLEVAHLTDEDHVGVLPQHVLERLREPVGVGAHLALVDDAALVAMEELDRVLDGHDVPGPLTVHDVDHRGERRRLPRARGAGDDDEAPLEASEVHDDVGDPEVVHVLDLERDHAEHGADGVALLEHVDTEPGSSRQRVRHVELELLLEPFPELLRQDRVDHALQGPRCQRRVLPRRLQLSVNPHHRRGTRREVQVGAPLLQERAEQLRHRDLYVLILLDH